ncbi:MAG: hybrid sensor histidine kinase/response regulator [Nitrospira sp.]|nr:MAG: hybrid sensor histidine kinase/response regulator [Nitrospira sp.]
MNLRSRLKDVASERSQGLVPTSAPTRYQLILLHTLVTIVLCYQLLFSKAPLVAPLFLDLIALGLLATIVGLVVAPIRIITSTWSVAALALADTIMTTLSIYLSGNASSDLYITYFLIMLIAAFAPTLKQMIGLSVTLCLVYGSALFLSIDQPGELDGGRLLHIPILLLLAVFYGLTNEAARMLNRDKTALLDSMNEQRRAEQALRHSEERYRCLVEVSPDAIFITKHNRIVFINRTGMALLGAATSEQIIGRSAFDFLHPEHDPATNQQIRHALENGIRIPLLECKMLRLDGTMIDVELAGSPLADQGSATIQVVVRNITDRRQLEEQLRQSQKMDAVGQLAGGVAHDFNNMLLIIGGFSDLLANDAALTEDQRSSVEQIRQASKRAGGLTTQLLAFSRRQVLQPKVVNLDKLVGNLEHMLRTLVGESIEYLFISDPLLGCVKADPGQIEQSVINLVVNARDAMHQGGRLIISTGNVDLDEETIRRDHLEAKPGPHIQLVVSDTGVGMNADTLARIYEPFFTTKPKGKGTGLGLSTVYGIVRQSGGCIHVHSSMGQGTTFSIYLPRVEDVIDPTGDDGNQGSTLTGSETILVAEDEPGVRALVSHTLRQHGYTVLEASHGVEALVISEQHTKAIHLLLTDVVMPQLNGRELAERLVAKLPELQVLYMSGYPDDAVLRRGLSAADTNFLHKPFTTGALANRVRQLLNTRPLSLGSLTN